jgi:putative ABC transport system permease protein
MEHLIRDVRWALRMFRSSPAFTVASMATLALGIGATAAIFSVVSALVLRPLPFPHPERLVQMYGTSPLVPQRDAVAGLVMYRAASRSFDALAGYEVSARYLRNPDGAERVVAVQAERSFFSVLAVPPILGRTFRADDPMTLAVVSEAFWRQRLGADPSAIGRAIPLDDETFTIIGVMPASFQFPYRPAARIDLWIPLDMSPRPRGRIGQVTGRLKAGVSLQAAERELQDIARRFEREDPTNKGRSVQLVPLAEAVIGTTITRLIFILFGAVAIVLTLACANVINLSLARMTVRSREVAVRSALGASRLRLARQFLVESLLLAAGGGVIGLAIAWWGTRRLSDMASRHVARAGDVALDWRVFLFLLAVCAATGIILSLLPAVVAVRQDVRSVLQESGGHSTAGRAQRRLRDSLVVAEVALAFVLAVGAALLIRELIRLRDTDPGIRTDNVITFHVGHRMTPRTDVLQFYDIADRAAQIPGVRAAGFIQMLPLQNAGWTANSGDFMVRGRPPHGQLYPIELRYVTPGYFDALGVRIVRGRALTAADTRDTPPVILINETLARRHFPDADPVGLETTRGTIVGVVSDVRQAHLDRPAAPEIYYAAAQNWSQLSQLGMTLVVRTAGPPQGIVAPVRAIVRDVNRNLAVFDVKTMERVLAESLSDFTLYLSLMAAFAALAVILAMTGTYGVIAYLVTSRTREFAIRIALGAQQGRVIRLVLGQGVLLTVIGVGLGLVVAFAARPLLRDLPVSVRPPDVATALPVALLLAVVAVLACLIPARRAAAADPMSALRNE